MTTGATKPGYRPEIDGLRAAKAALTPRYYIDILRLLDDGTGTVPVFTPGRKFISQDRQHVTSAGAKFVGGMVFAAPAFAALPPPRGAAQP